MTFALRPIMTVKTFVIGLALSTSLTSPQSVRAQMQAEAQTQSEGPSVSTLSGARGLWRDGDRESALRAAEAIARTSPTPDSLLLVARLYDALGKPDASDWYVRARDATDDAALRREIDLRLAIMAGTLDPEALVAYAEGKAGEDAAQLAPIVALLDRPAAALELAGTKEPAAARADFADRLEHAQWALAAEDYAKAKTAARRALDAADGVDDTRYALALLVEAYRGAGDLESGLAVLQRLPASAPVVAARADVLLELGRVDEAIALVEASDEPASQRRLIGMLDLAGDQTGSEAEYRRLIAADPQQAEFYGRLAALYFARGDEEQAVATYRSLFVANRGRAEILTHGARLMIGMGLQDQAVSLLESASSDPAVRTATHLFLFETYLDRGDVDKALAELRAVEAGDTRGLLIDDIVDGYDRIGRPQAALDVLIAAEARGRVTSYDRRARMAQLAAITGHEEDALRRWQALREQATLPARRNFIERQIVDLARRTDRLVPLIRELSAKLDRGALRPDEIDLLVGFYLAQEQPDAAADAVRRFASRQGRGEAAMLAQLVRLYGRVRDQTALEATLRRLVAIDPANRDTNIRRLILNMLRNPGGDLSAEARQAELDRLLAQLSTPGEGDGAAFRATVYTEAGLDGQALDELRTAVLASPGDPDSLLRLAAELTRQRRRDEAIGLLQYAVGEAREPVLFAALVDGLIDVSVDAPVGSGETQTALSWALRRVLERIGSDGANGRLLGLVADIAAASADYDLQMRATEALVADAGEQRGQILRELATLAGGTGSETGATVIGDPERRLIYARRLLALGKSFPPDVYAGLARTLLDRGDEAGAERAFAMMSGMGGLVNVDEAKGDAYEAAGRYSQALANYARALLQDQSNFDLMVKTGILHEWAGQDAQAWRWYWRGLRTLIARQPSLARPGGDDERELDVRRYYATLVEGLLLTWPQAPDGQAALEDLNQQFSGELADLSATEDVIFADRPKLALIVDLGWRIVDANFAGESLSGWDSALARQFAQDDDFLRAAMLRRQAAGRARPVSPGEAWPLAALEEQQIAAGNDVLRLVLGIEQDDEAAIRALLAAGLAEEGTAREAIRRGQASRFRQPLYLLQLVEAMDRLPADRFRNLVWAPLAASPARDAILFDIFRAAPERYARLEALIGSQLLAPDTLVAQTIAQGNRPLGISLRTSRGDDNGTEWLTRLESDQLVTLYGGLVDRLARSGEDSLLSDAVLAEVLTRSLDGSEQARLADVLERDVAIARDPRSRSGAPLVARLLQFDALPANRPLVLKAAQLVAARYPDSAILPALLRDWYEGDRDRAFEGLNALVEGMAAHGQTNARLDRIIAEFLPDVRQRQIEAFLADPAPDRATAERIYQRYGLGDINVSRAQRLAIVRRMLELDPQGTTYRDQLLGLYVAEGDWEAFADALRPDTPLATAMLAIAERLRGAPEAAADLLDSSGIDIDDPDLLVRLLNRGQATRARGGGGDLASLFVPLFDAYRARFPALPAIVAVGVRQGRSTVESVSAEEVAVGPFLNAATQAGGSVRGTIRRLWRQSASSTGGEATDRVRSALVRTLVSSARAGGAGAPLLSRPEILAELRRYLAVMAPQDRAEQQALYDLVAAGEPANARGQSALDEQIAALRSGEPDADALYHTLALANAAGAVLPPADILVFDERMRAMPAMSPMGRIALARLYARNGLYGEAGALLEAVTYQLLYPGGSLDTVDDLGAAMTQMVSALSLWHDDAARRQVYERLYEIVETRKRGASGGDLPGLPPVEEAVRAGA